MADLADYEELDATDAAHPAWWRGHEHTTRVFCQQVNEILDGKDDGRGIANEPWESTRRRLLDLIAANHRRHERPTMPSELEELRRPAEELEIGAAISAIRDNTTGNDAVVMLIRRMAFELGMLRTDCEHLAAELATLRAAINSESADLDEARKIAATVLSVPHSVGDSYGVPPMSEVVDELVTRLAAGGRH